MLVLSRKKDEEIVIDVPPSTSTTQITIVVAEFRGEKVRLGITAPRNVSVDRKEVYEEKHQ